jgi:hypothetical protein
MKIFLDKIISKKAKLGFGGHHTKFLRFFEILCKFKNKYIHSNLRKLLNLFIDNSHILHDILYMNFHIASDESSISNA